MQAYAKALWLTLKDLWTPVLLAVLLALIAVSLVVLRATIGV
jgi:hypothetical protein